MQGDFVERLREKAHQAGVQFGEEVAASSAQHLADLTERAQVSINEAQTQINGALAALSKSQEGVRAETDRAVIEAQQKARYSCRWISSRISEFRRQIWRNWRRRSRPVLKLSAARRQFKLQNEPPISL